MPKSKPSPLTCEHANECPAVCPCPPGCYCKKNTCKPVKKSKKKGRKKWTVKLRVYMAAYEGSKKKQGVELTLDFPREPKTVMEKVSMFQQIEAESEKCLAIRVKYPGNDWEKFEHGGEKS